MSCKHPLKAFKIGVKENGKDDLMIVPYETDHIEFRAGHWIKVKSSELSPYCEKAIYSFTTIPCGKCIGCRLEYSRQWANRCLLEMSQHEENYFVTITYNDRHVPFVFKDGLFDDCGVLNPNPEKHRIAGSKYDNPLENYWTDLINVSHLTLWKKDIQLFLKRLRKNTGQNFRYFLCGEYGDHTLRPHYHLVLFGLHLPEDDLEFMRESDQGFKFYKSKTIEKAWSMPYTGEPIGFNYVAPATWETAAYTARYCTKKLNGKEAQNYEALGIEPEFVLMSRKPGIGYKYLEDHPDLFEYDSINVGTKNGSKKFKVPKYFLRKLEEQDEDLFLKIKARNKYFATYSEPLKKLVSSQGYLDALRSEEINLIARTKALERNEI